LERHLKERLTGATVLVLFGVIFIPMVLDNSSETQKSVRTVLPPKQNTEYQSRIIPVEGESIPEKNLQSNQVDSGNSIQKINPVIPVKEAPESNNESAELNANISAVTTSNINLEEQTETKIVPNNSEGLSAWVIQLGSFTNQINAESLVNKLQLEGYPAYIEELIDNSESIHRVRVGPELNREDAEKLQQTLVSHTGIKGIILSYP